MGEIDPGEGDGDRSGRDQSAKYPGKQNPPFVAQRFDRHISDKGNGSNDHRHQPGLIGIEKAIGPYHFIGKYRKDQKGHRQKKYGCIEIALADMLFDLLKLWLALQQNDHDYPDKNRILFQIKVDHQA